jgi:mannan endo-1,6-alpha-mannosidase
MMSFYKGNESGQIPGQLPGPPPTTSVTNAGYFWWETGAMFGSMIDYWYYTGDDTYNEVVKQGMVFQSNGGDYLPQNQTKGMGNDDQAFWGMAAMTAAELNFTNPDADEPGWLEMAQGVYNTQVPRFDDLCGGGLHWQAYEFLNGYSYKNAIANGCFFNLAARLAAYTGNDTYAKHAASAYDWTSAIGLIDADFKVYDGTDSNQNCTIINRQQFSYNAAVFLYGAATMYNYVRPPRSPSAQNPTNKLPPRLMVAHSGKAGLKAFLQQQSASSSPTASRKK